MIINISEQQVEMIINLLRIASAAHDFLDNVGDIGRTTDGSVKLEAEEADMRVLDEALDKLDVLPDATPLQMECAAHRAAHALSSLTDWAGTKFEHPIRRARNPEYFPDISVVDKQGKALQIFSMQKTSRLRGIRVMLNDDTATCSTAVKSADRNIAQWLCALLKQDDCSFAFKNDIRLWLKDQDAALAALGIGATQSRHHL